MSMFKKPKKNLRQRMAVSDDDDGNNSPPPVKVENASMKSSKSSEVKSKKAPTKTSILSFQEDLEGDEGIETFQIKKSMQSRRIAKKMERDRKKKEQEQESSKVYVEESAPVPKEEPATVKKPGNLILSGREAEMAGYRSESEDESDNEGIKFRHPDPFRNVLESGSIPDAAMIHAARKHRQQARELGGLSDYIKVEDMPNFESEQAEVTTARLVREDDNDKSDEDEGEDGRMDFSVDLQTKDKQQRREAFLAAEQEDVHSNSSDEHEDENENWERQQFQKAIRQRQIENAHQEKAFQDHFNEIHLSSDSDYVRKDATSMPLQSSRTKTVTRPDLSKLAPLPSPKELQEKLKKRLASLQEVNHRHENNLERAQSALTDSQEAIEKLQNDRPRLSERYKYFQSTRNYIADLTDCLRTKSYDVDAIEKKWISLLTKRHRYLVDRRREDIDDEAGDCAIQAVIGQSADPEKIARTAEREARRRRRRLNRKDSRHKEGLSSDEEIGDKEASASATDREKIQRESEDIFADTLEDFCSLEVITKQFDELRTKEKETYRDAYIELFLPRLSGCIVRTHFFQALWNPLEHEVGFIKKSSWFHTLTEYDLKSDINYDSRPKEVNTLVISKTIEMVVIPYITEVVKAAYDPCSASQTNRVVKLIKNLIDEHPSIAVSGKAIQALCKAAVEKFEVSAEKDVYVPFHFAAHSPLFVNRQFWLAAKLMRNILCWQNIVEDAQLRSIAMDRIFKKNMLLALTKTTVKGANSDPETLDKVSYIADALPKSWLGPLAPNAAQLQPLIDVVMFLAQNADCTTHTGRKQVKSVAAVLQTLGANAEAQEILVKYL